MATINGSTNSSYWTFKLEITENGTDIANNTSSVTVSAYIGRKSTTNSSYMHGTNLNCTIVISSSAYNDSKKFNYSNTNRVNFAPGDWLKIGSVTFPSVKHENDGVGKITVSASFTNNISPANGSASGTVDLTKIARASSVSMNDSSIGSTATITITAASTIYSHKLEYEFYKDSGTIASLNAGVVSYSWNIPTSLANQIPNASSGTCTIRCITYNGSTEIGRKEITVKLGVLAVPTIDESTYTISIYDGEGSQYSDWGIFLSGYSKAKITAKATAYYGASIDHFGLFIGGVGSVDVKPTGTNKNEFLYVTDVLTSGGTKNFGLNVFDSRGLPSSRYQKSIEIHQYIPPSIKTFTAARSEENQSVVVIKCNWTYDEVGRNASVGRVYYKEGKNGTYSTTPIEVTKGSEIILEDTFDVTKSYYFKLIVTDVLGSVDEREAFISTREVLMDFRAGGKGLAIGKISESDSFEVNMDARFMKDIYIYVNDEPVLLADYIKLIVNSM